MSSFTAWVMMGSETIRVTSNTSMTSINGVVLMSHMTPPPAFPTLIAICLFSSYLLAHAAHAVVRLREEADLHDATALQGVQHPADRFVARLAIGADMNLG